MGFAVVRVELLVGEENRRAWMVEVRTGPKDPFLCVDSFVSDAVVISDPAARGNAKLFKNIGRILKLKILTSTQPMRDINNDVGIATRLTGRVNAFLPVNDAALDTASEAIFFFMQAAGKDHV